MSQLKIVEILIGTEEWKTVFIPYWLGILFPVKNHVNQSKVWITTWLRSRDSKVFLWRMTTFIILHPKIIFHFMFRLAYMWAKVKVRMYTWLGIRDSKIFLWRMATFYNPASRVMWLYSISYSDWHTCELKLRLKCLVALGEGTVKNFFGEWSLFIILQLESCDCIPFPVQFGIHVN